MSSPDDDRARLERLLAAADRVANQPLPPPPPPRSRVLTIVTLGVIGVGALVLGIGLAVGGDGQPSTATQTTAVPTAVTTAVPSTTLPIVITFPPTTIAATTTEPPPTTSTTSPATTTTWVLPPMSTVRSLSYEGTTLHLRGAVPDVATANRLRDLFAAAWGPGNVAVEYTVADGVPLPDSEPLYAHQAMQFPPNGIELQPAAVEFLDTLAAFMLQNQAVGLDIRAYTDGVGPSDSNLELSQRRADAAFLHLVAVGVDPARMTSTGFGEASPVADDSTPEGRALNRRVEFTLHDVLG